jgi:hypothetical protein
MDHLHAFGCGGLAASWLSRMHTGGFDNVMMYGFAAACVLGPIAAVTQTCWLRWLGTLLLLGQFAWLGHAAWLRDPSHTLLPAAAHANAHEELRAFVRAQPGPVWIPAHGGITRSLGKGTGAHGQAIFDLLQLLPRLPDGMFDPAALLDRSKLAHLAERERAAIAGLLDTTVAMLEARHFAAIVVDEVGAHAFTFVFAMGLLGADLQLGTADDTYVRAPGPLLTQPTAIRPLLGYDVHSPYALLPRR